MIRTLTQTDRQLILNFIYPREKENLFITGVFERPEDPFATNSFYGWFEGKKLLGLAVYFGQWKNLNISAQDEKIVRALTDHLMAQKHKLDDLACFRRYAEIIIDQLEKKHDMTPKKINHETVFKLSKKDFKDFSTGTEETAKNSDRKELVLFERLMFKEGIKTPITKNELNRIILHEQFLIRKNKKIISAAHISGLSKNYFQIGGVGTLEKYRNQGLAKQVVSALCKTFLAQGKTGLLFTRNDNSPAQKVYETLGFKPVDEFIIAEY
ncbi:MAG: GNAT family N-acetyltransferase [Candidatus Gracilibacteria bacterium]